jgi:hypothetical protein
MALKLKAFDGNVPAAKLLLEWAGVYGKNATPIEVADEKEVQAAIEGMSDEQLMALLDAEDKEELAIMKELDIV